MMVCPLNETLSCGRECCSVAFSLTTTQCCVRNEWLSGEFVVSPDPVFVSRVCVTCSCFFHDCTSYL